MSAVDLVRSHPDGAILTAWVVPGARRTEIVGLHGDALKIRVSAAPEKGLANRAVAQLLGNTLDAKVRLAAGATSRRKRFVVVGVDATDLAAKIDLLLN